MNTKSIFWVAIIMLTIVLAFSFGGILLSRDIYLSFMVGMSKTKIPSGPQLIGFMLGISVSLFIIFDFIRNGKQILWALITSIVVLLIWKFFPIELMKDLTNVSTLIMWGVGVIVSLLFGKLVYEISSTPTQ